VEGFCLAPWSHSLEPKCSSLLFRLGIDLIEQPRGLTLCLWENCSYVFIVTLICEWPLISITIRRWMPWLISTVAQSCRTS
jgi:hypothetical protein